MVLEINYNKEDMIRLLLEQTIPQMNIDAFFYPSCNIKVGSLGGVSMPLFHGQLYEGPLDVHTKTGAELLATRHYLDALDSYLKSAEEHANQYGFQMVIFEEGCKLEHYDLLQDTIKGVGIGTLNVNSINTLEKFLQMYVSATYPSDENKSELFKQKESLIDKLNSVKKAYE